MVSTRKFIRMDSPVHLALPCVTGIMATGAPLRSFGSAPANSSATGGTRHGFTAQDCGDLRLGHRSSSSVFDRPASGPGTHRRLLHCSGLHHGLRVDADSCPAYPAGDLPSDTVGRQSRSDRAATDEAT